MHLQITVLFRVGAWMTLAITSFAGMAVAAREMAGSFSVFEMLAMRSIIGLAAMIAFISITGRSFTTRRPALQLARSVMHFAGQYCWTVGVLVLPLAEVVALEFTVPVWGALLAIAVLHERLTLPRTVAVIGGFIGILVVVRPGTSLFDPLSLVVLAAAVFYAGSVVMVKMLTRADGTTQVLFYMTLVQTPLGLMLALPNWIMPSVQDIPWLLVFGITGLTAHLGLTKSLALADATFVMPIDYLRLPVVGIVGYLVYGEILDLWVIAGAGLIIASSYYSIRAEARARS
jgi:S-adenosylmethionine uptake transporter